MREVYPSGSTSLPQLAQRKPLSFFEKRLVSILFPHAEVFENVGDDFFVCALAFKL